MSFKNFIIWGSAGHSKVLNDIIEAKGGRVLALFDSSHKAVSSIPRVPLYYGEEGFRHWMKQNPRPNVSGAIAIGGSKGSSRIELANIFADYKIPMPSLMHDSATISRSAKLGVGSHVLANSVVAADVNIGAFAIINNSANIDHESEIGDGVHIAPGATICGCVSIGDNTLIGAGAIILPRIRIGKNSIVGAGAIVTKNVPNNVIVGGNPAIFFRKRGGDD